MFFSIRYFAAGSRSILMLLITTYFAASCFSILKLLSTAYCIASLPSISFPLVEQYSAALKTPPNLRSFFTAYSGASTPPILKLFDIACFTGSTSSSFPCSFLTLSSIFFSLKWTAAGFP